MAELEIERQTSSSNNVAAHDEDRLAQFGYKQELQRDWVCYVYLSFSLSNYHSIPIFVFIQFIISIPLLIDYLITRVVSLVSKFINLT